MIIVNAEKYEDFYQPSLPHHLEVVIMRYYLDVRSLYMYVILKDMETIYFPFLKKGV